MIRRGLASPSKGDKPSRERVISVGSWLGLGLLLFALRPPLGPTGVPIFELGQVADKTIIAPFPFKVTKSKAELEKERAVAAAQEPQVFQALLESRAGALERLRSLQGATEAIFASPDTMRSPTAALQPLSEATIQLLALGRDREEAFEGAAEVLSALLSRRIAPRGMSLAGAREFVVVLPDSTERSLPADSLIPVERALALLSAEARSRYPERELMARAIYEIASPFVIPTVAMDPMATELRRARAVESVAPFKGTMLTGEVIVEAHYRITDADIDELRSLQEAYHARASAAGGAGDLAPLLGHLLWTGFFLVILAASLRGLSPGILRSPSDTALVVLLLALLAFFGYAALHWLRLPPSSIPLAAIAILATVFFDARVGFGVTMLGLLLSASYYRFDLSGLVGPLAGALVAVFWIRQLRKRRDFLLAALWIFLAAAGAGTSTGLIFESSGAAMTRGIGLSAANAVISLFFVIAAFPVLEVVFHRTTDLRLLELLDMNHILLRELALEAPGTYHHSIVVGNLSEAACDGIGANALLARVGAYYHDIGKMTKPQYFSENQTVGENPHDRLSPKMSALVIASHVKEGIRLAHKERLPPTIVQFVAEHHGTTQISFFYKKMKEHDPGSRLDPEDFSYPGPKPRSRETAVVMLADAAEGATRALDEPTAARIRQVVHRVIHERLTAGQLDECNLTFRDLERIREGFVPILVGVHHHRVKYPEGVRDAAQ